MFDLADTNTDLININRYTLSLSDDFINYSVVQTNHIDSQTSSSITSNRSLRFTIHRLGVYQNL